MPIRKEMLARYPKDWKQIRERILCRAGQTRNKRGEVMGEARCEWCGVLDRSFGQRDSKGKWTPLGLLEAESASMEGEKVVKIILTIAHVHDMNPENCADDNLAALCQRCHNRHDVEHRKGSRAQTKLRRDVERGQMFLPEAKA